MVQTTAQLLYSCVSLCKTQGELEMGDAFLLFPQYKSVSSSSLKVGATLSLKFKGNFEYKQTLPYCCLYNHIYKEVVCSRSQTILKLLSASLLKTNFSVSLIKDTF